MLKIEKLTRLFAFVVAALLTIGCEARCPRGTKLVRGSCERPVRMDDASLLEEEPEAGSMAPAAEAAAAAPDDATPERPSGSRTEPQAASAPATPAAASEQKSTPGVDAGTALRADAGTHPLEMMPRASEPAAMKAPACAKEAAVRCAASTPGRRERCEAGAWIDADGCAADELCVADGDDALCVTLDKLCAGREGRSVCNDAGELLMCDDHGTSTLVEACADPRLCIAGMARGACASCVPGSYKCTGNQLQACSAEGSAFVLQQECASPALCVEDEGRCAPALCKPDEYRCEVDALKRCNRALNGFDVQRLCGPGLCDEANETCRACMPGQRKCSGDMRLECDASGQKFVAAACPAATPVCTAGGSCAECKVSGDCATHACQVSSCSSGTCSYAPEPKGVPRCNVPDGSTVRVKDGDEKVFVVVGGAKFWIHSTDDLETQFGGFANTMALDSAVVASCNGVPAAGTNVQEVGDVPIYRIGKDGQAHHILHLEDLLSTCGGGDSVNKIPTGGLMENGIGKGSDI